MQSGSQNTLGKDGAECAGAADIGEQTENLPFKHWGPINMLKKNKQVFVSERRGIDANGQRPEKRLHGHQRNKDKRGTCFREREVVPLRVPREATGPFRSMWAR